MSAPNFAHQSIVGDMNIKIGSYLADKECRVFVAPFDVRLPKKQKDDSLIYTVVQPDLIVVCDKAKYDIKGCIGAPDIVVEVLSPGNNKKELKNKYDIYEEAGVLEYWVVSPQDYTFFVYKLVNGKFVPIRPFTVDDVITTTILPGFELNLKNLFARTSF